MARACTVCTHPERARLELGLARHVPMKTLEQRFRTPEHPLSVAALSRHRVGHMPDRLKAQLKLGQKDTEIDLDALRNSESEGLLQHLVGQRGRLYHLCDRAEQVDDLRAASSLHGRIIDNLSLTAKLLGELGHNHQTTVNNLIVSPEYLTLRSRLIEALRQFPEARRAVAAILRDLEERPGGAGAGVDRGAAALMATRAAVDLLHALDVAAFARACGLEQLDDWQRLVLETEHSKVILNCSRQSGKSTVAALLALHTAIYHAPSLVLMLSPSQRQSTELYRKFHDLWQALPGRPEADLESVTRVELRNGSRVISLPGSERTTRGFSRAKLVILDEVARIDDQLINSVRPMMATSRSARLVELSTPYGRRGHFFDRWHSDDPGWLKVRVTADQCPRIDPLFLEEEKRELGPLVFSQEYMCHFVDSAEALFPSAVIEQAFSHDVRPIFE